MRSARTLAAVAALLAANAADAACRQALVLALDVSGSVDDREYALQIHGVASALDDARVRGALLAMPEASVALTIFEWAGAKYQRDILNWTLIIGESDIDRVVAHLRDWRRRPAPQATAIGAALGHAERRIAAGPPCWRRTVDVSGDGKNNDWPAPRDFYRAGGLGAATVNGLVIGDDPRRLDDDRQLKVPELKAYFEAHVIRGPQAFVEVALGYEDYAAAMTRKLLRELATVAIGELGVNRGVPARAERTMLR